MILSRFSFFSGKLKPNLGRFNDPPDWTEILTYFRGSELQNYFTKVLEDDLKAFIKVQYVDQIPKAVKGTVQALLDKKDEQNIQDKICDILDLNRVSLFLMLFCSSRNNSCTQDFSRLRIFALFSYYYPRY